MRTEWTVELEYSSEHYPALEEPLHKVIDAVGEEVSGFDSGLGFGMRDMQIRCKTKEGSQALYYTLKPILDGLHPEEAYIGTYVEHYANVTCPSCGIVNEVWTTAPNSEYRCEKCTEWLHDDLERT
jgi:hypothetical protein